MKPRKSFIAGIPQAPALAPAMQEAPPVAEPVAVPVRAEVAFCDEPQVRCPHCGSTQLHSDRRGWSLITGFIGSGKIFITCLLCGNRFRPGKWILPDAPQSYQPPPPPTAAAVQEAKDLKAAILIVVGVVVFVFILAIIRNS